MNNFKKNAGISLVALIITIIVLIILTAAVIIVGINTPENNEYAVKMHNKATLQDAVTLYVMTEMLNDIDNFVITSTGATKARDVADVVKDLYENGTWKDGANVKLGVNMTLNELNTVFELDDQAVVTFAEGQEPTLDGTEGGNNNNQSSSNNNQSSSNNNEQPVTLRSVLSGKNFSILGDSISTFSGYSNNASTTNSTIGSNAVYYGGSNIITNVNDTWWMQAINQTGMNLLVNNSWSGDRVSNRGKTRAMQLHDNTGDNAGTIPDIIAVYIGINDMKDGSTVSAFETNYQTMISNMRTTYPNADIFVLTHVPYYYNCTVSSMTNDQLEQFNNVIRNIASQTTNCFVVDYFADSGINQSNFKAYMGDVGLHPNVSGMDKITETLISAFEEKYNAVSDYNDNTQGGNNNNTQVITPTGVQLVPGVVEAFPASSIASSKAWVPSVAPFAYIDTSYFAGKTITTIGVPVKTVSAIDANQTFTISVIKNDLTTTVNTYTLKAPIAQLGSSTTVNKWIYFDCNITVGADETLAFFGSTDTVIPGYLTTGANNAYKFKVRAGQSTVGAAGTNDNIYVDVYAAQ